MYQALTGDEARREFDREILGLHSVNHHDEASPCCIDLSFACEL
jgi:hypothetical protein